MRRPTTLLLLLIALLFLPTLPAHAQNGKADKQTWQPTTALEEGIERARKKDLKKAALNFQEALNHWQLHAVARLYLQVLKDAENKRLKKKEAVELFKSVDLERKNDHKKALKTISKLLKKKKNYAPFYIVKGELLADAEDNQAAEAAFAAAIDHAADSPLPYLLRGRYYARTHAEAEAVDDFTAAVTTDPDLAIGFFERGFVYCLEKKYDLAIKDFEVAAQTYPAWGKAPIVNEAYYGRGSKRFQQHSYRRALADFERAIRIDSTYLNSYLNRGLCYRGLKAYSKALKDFSFCIAQDPEFKDAYYERAATYYTRRRYSQALPDLLKTLELDPADKRARLKLGECYYQLRKYNQAIAQFDKLIKQDSGYFLAYYWKGYACKDSRRYKQALAAFRQFLKLAPQHYYKQIAHAQVEIKRIKAGIR